MGELKVLIVDDEYLIRNLLKMRIDWEKQGMKIIGEAANAAEALEFVDKQKPDIIFTDIYMPSIDGIEFSERVLNRYPDIKIVVVTGHNEFEYAQKSIKLGITDFILKPIRADELLSVAGKLRSQIEEERAREQELEELKGELKKNFPYLREKFLYHWLNGTLPLEEIYEKAEYFQVPLRSDANAFQIAVVEVSSASAKESEEKVILLQMECRTRIEAYFKADPRVIIFTDPRNQIIILFLNQGVEDHLANECEVLLPYLIESASCTVSIGIGRQHKRLDLANVGFEEACRALQYQAFVGKNQVVCFEEVVENREQQYHSNSEQLEQLQFYISVGASERALHTLRLIFGVPFANVSQFRMAATDVMMECQRAALEQQIENEQVFDKETLVSVLTAEHLPELLQTLESHVLQVCKAILLKKEAKEGNLIGQVKTYLENNMSNPDVGLAGTAAAFYISPGHLGRLMKKETGQTFVEYLTQIRMKKAEVLLKQTDLRGYEIGEMVGITDPHYFSILFKKHVGRSMNEYRNGKE